MTKTLKSITSPNVMKPIGPYSHVVTFGDWITISAIAGVNPTTGELAGPDVKSQTEQILNAFEILLEAAGSNLEHIAHVNVFLKSMDDFSEMNEVYEKRMGVWRPARTCIAVSDLPKPGARLTMNLTAVTAAKNT